MMAKQKGDFRYVMNAQIYYRPVSTIKDFLQLSDRSFSKNEEILAEYFSAKVYDIYHIPMGYKLKAVAVSLLKSPLYTSFALLLNMYTMVFPKHDLLYASG